MGLAVTTGRGRAVRSGAWAIGLMGALCAVALLVAPVPARALGPNAVRNPTGAMATQVTPADDTSNLVVDLPFEMNWNGTPFSQIYINMNGNCTFGNTFTEWDPNPTLASRNRNIMAPFWADVDTRNAASGKLWYSDVTNPPLVDGHEAFIVTWNGVARYNNTATPLDYFQLVLIDRSDIATGDFDFEFNYDQMLWDRGTAASTGYARAGWAINGGASYELPGANSSGALLDSGAASTSLIKNSLNSGGQLGRYVWQVRNGSPPVTARTITVTDRTLEGNTRGAYAVYTGVGDYTADTGVQSITTSPSLPATLPLGTHTIEWTALFAGGITATATQGVVVTDTTPPSAPIVTSSTHTAGTWTNVPTVTVTSVNSTDLCSGMQDARYSWTLDAPGAADTAASTTVATTTITTTTTVESQDFSAGTWPADWVRSGDTGFARLSATRFHLEANGAEVYDDNNNNTRRTVTFAKTFDLSAYDSATISFWDNRSAFSSAADYKRVRYSTNGGGSWTNIYNVTGAQATAQGWLQQGSTLPTAAAVIVQFTGSVNAATEYVNWDEILIQGVEYDTDRHLQSTETTELPDGTWYYNLQTRDVAGNWSTAGTFGPVRIDRYPPLTTDDAPGTWATAPVTVSLTATDAGSGVAGTRYRVNSSAVTSYTAPFVISLEQTNTLYYQSVDNRGNWEATKSVSVRIDAEPPTVPTSFTASAATTTSVDMSWNPSTDTTSGLSHYRIYRDGSFVATSGATTYVLSGLTASQTYTFNVAAVDVAGNISALSTTETVTMPQSQLWMTIEPTSVSLGTMDPGDTATLTQATTITVGGVGSFDYTLSTYSEDFTAVTSAAPVPTMTVSALSYQMYGSGTQPWTPFTTTSQDIATGTGISDVWSHPYYFDFRLATPWDASPGTYTSRVTYTVVAN